MDKNNNTILTILVVIAAVVIIYYLLHENKTHHNQKTKIPEHFTLNDQGQKYCKDALFRARQCCRGCGGDFCKEDCLGVYNTDIVMPPINCPFVFPDTCAMINE